MSNIANYNKILSQFQKGGYNENSTLTEPNLKKILNQICQRNANIREFNADVAEELWLECEKNPDNTVTLRNYVNIISRAHSILKENITKSENELASTNVNEDRRSQLEEGIVQYTQDLKLLTLPFQIQGQQQSRYVQQSIERSRASNNQSNLQASGISRASGIFSDVPSARENSYWLKFSFILTVIMFILQLVIMFHKNHFYNTLVYISIFAIIVMGYFDKYYIKFVLVNIFLSVLFDFLWIILQASPYWNPNPPTHHSTIQTPFLRFMYMFVIILMLAKVLLFLLFFRYRNNDDTIRKSVSILGSVYEINGKIKDNNPVSLILSGQGLLASGFH